MGFFSSILGGSKSSSSSGGFNQLPEEIRGAYTGLGSELEKILQGSYGAAYKPTPISAGEQSAIDRMYKGFAPTAESISSDISMQQNPYDKYVIDEINRQAGGDYSILKQALNEAGQMGSNRQNLGANDIDLSRLNQIGSFKQDWYKDAMKNALTTLPGMRSADATTALGAGSYMRDIDAANSSAQIRALQEIAKAMGILPTVEGSQTSTSKGGGGIGGLLGSGGVGGAISGIGSLFSDIRLKENIKQIGMESGHKIYEFNYVGESARNIGVMAQDVIKTHPNAVIMDDSGFYKVNYDAIGVKFREAA